ncbi:MAG: LPP20 family lipoprotein [Marinilabiliaceae bacterium]|nr:LPP20 family lipoprotein [Marinilabiliaceae bacterium]
MNKLLNTCYIIVTLLIASCSSTKQTAKKSIPQPEWITNRPITNIYYTGIGIAKKWGLPDNYKSDARQKALSDMASQINSNVSSTSVLHQVENNKGISELYSNNIKTSSKEFLEGYQEIDSYEDENYYYVYFQLSKAKFAALKEQRKAKAFSNAKSKFQQAQIQNNNIATSLKLYASSLEAMDNFLGDENMIIDSATNKKLDICIESVNKIKELINNLKISPVNSLISKRINEFVESNLLTFNVSDINNNYQPNIPVKFKYSNGFLRTDKSISDLKGQVKTTIHKLTPNGNTHTLCAEIDVNSLIQSITQNLFIRKMIENTGGNTSCIQIKIIQ